GYTVYDLGKQVPLQKFVEKINEVRPDAIGLSALLVSTSKQMQYFVEHAKQNNFSIPILCGGAAINSNYVNRIAKEGGIYPHGVFYCKTMFDGLKTMDKLVSTDRAQFVKEWKEKIEKWQETKVERAEGELPHSGIEPVKAPHVPVLNKPIRLDPKDIDLEEVWKHLSKKSLFVLSWGLRGKVDAQAEGERLLKEWKKKVLVEKLFEPRAVYGYFVCHNMGNKLVVDYPDGKVTFDFPRSTQNKHLCLADYFGENDVVAFQAVTVGDKTQQVIEKWNKEDRYTDAYYLHGLAVETAEALAEFVNLRIKNELGLDDKRRLRYSWGYPSCPDVSQHHLVWELLKPQKSGMTLTEAGQIVPEQSTAAIIVHHPQAEYFVL
ncbi:MAG: vitamin B12 dependent-methionine synthase activation domain-containing protein, partial [Candidatus Nitrosotenuis sp.]